MEDFNRASGFFSSAESFRAHPFIVANSSANACAAQFANFCRVLYYR